MMATVYSACGMSNGIKSSACVTGVPRSEETAPHSDPTVGMCLGPYGGPRGGGLCLMSEVPLNGFRV